MLKNINECELVNKTIVWLIHNYLTVKPGQNCMNKHYLCGILLLNKISFRFTLLAKNNSV